MWVISPSSCWWCPNSGHLFSVRSNIASFPGLPQRGGGSPIERMPLAHMFFILNQAGAVRLLLCRCSRFQHLGQKLQDKASSSFFQWGTSPSLSTYNGRHWRHWRDKLDQAFPLCFCMLQVIKYWVVERPGNEARSNTPELHRYIVMWGTFYECSQSPNMQYLDYQITVYFYSFVTCLSTVVRQKKAHHLLKILTQISR